MTILFKHWTLDGSAAAGSWTGSIEYNGTQTSNSALPSGWVDVVRDPLDAGLTCLRIRVNADDDEVATGARTEIGESSATRVEIADWAGFEDVARWYRCQWMIPPEFDYTIANPNGATYFPCIFQVHETSDTSPADTVVGPTFWCLVEPDGAVRVYNTLTAPATDTQTTAGNWVTRHLITIPAATLGTWVDFVARVKWGWTAANASMELWVNRRRVFREVGDAAQPNTFNNAEARGGGKLYCKLGIYDKFHSSWGALIKESRVIYHRGLIVGDQSATFADMYPEDPAAVELPRGVGPATCRWVPTRGVRSA